jgi:hypothetical protein
VSLSGLAADLVLLLHFGFILYAACGGLLNLGWPRLMWLHLPCAIWGVLVEAAGWVCPLTPLEQRLRQAAGETGYGGGFIEHYLVPVIYPAGLTRSVQIALGLGLLLLNIIIYAVLLRRHRRTLAQGR